MKSLAHRSFRKKAALAAVLEVTKYVCPLFVANSRFGITISLRG
jgi:hypothetical protein